MAENNFLLPADDYQRSISPVKDWMKQTATYASLMTGKPYEACYNHLQKKLQDKEINFTNPKVIYFERGSNGDKEKTVAPLSVFIKTVISNNEILAPTFTTYLHPDQKRSVIVEYLDEKVTLRKKYKKASQKYEAEGDTAKFKYFHGMQDATKRKNNSVSGSFVADGSVINNKSAHSTLTSVTRSISSLSNASNERLIEGNRHYFTPQIALNNLISIVAETNHAAIEEAMHLYRLNYPSVDETIACVRRSLSLYIPGRTSSKLCDAFIRTLSPTERASIVYTGDFYHIRIHNEAFTREMVTDLSTRGTAEAMEDPVGFIYSVDEQIVNYAHQVNITMMRGKGKEYAEKLTFEEQCILANTCKNILHAVDKYKILLRAFFLTKNSPCTISTIPSMIRRSVVLSDTDSTMFSCDNWVQWYFGRLEFTDDGYAVAGAVAYMATQSIAHILALFSANMNVEKKRLFTLAMKPEFVFPVFAQTSVAKHYYTAMLVKEGNVYEDIMMEIKGVHMKDSTVPTNIITAAAKIMESIIRTVMSGAMINLKEIVHKAARLEQDILESMRKGETLYLRRFKIKEHQGYKYDKEHSPYQYYTLWEKAFAPFYGNAPLPPYDAVRIPLDLKNKTAVNDWMAAMPNQEIARLVREWFTENNKVTIGTFPIPVDICKSHGVPAELMVALDSRKIVLTLTKSFRNILESLGYYTKAKFMVKEQVLMPVVEQKES